MNRRELAQALLAGAPVPLFGVSALPEAVADTRKPQAALADSEDAVFHAVIIFDHGIPAFVVRGIYTLDSDAQAHLARFKASGREQVWNVVVDRAWLQEHFIGERMGELKDVLERLEARLINARSV